MQRRLDTETGANKPFENVSCQGLFQGKVTNFRHFFKRSFFFGKVNFKQLKYQKRLQEGPIACSPEKFLKICIL